MSYDLTEVDLGKGLKKLAVCGLIGAAGYFANDIHTHSTYERTDDGHYSNVLHIDGMGKSALSLGLAAFVALGSNGRKKVIQGTGKFIKQVFADEGR